MSQEQRVQDQSCLEATQVPKDNVPGAVTDESTASETCFPAQTLLSDSFLNPQILTQGSPEFG